MAIKDWIVIVGVVSLVLERIIRWIFKLIRPEKEIDSIAMDLVKLRHKGEWNSAPLTFFYLYKGALKKNLRWSKDYVDWVISKENELNRRIEEGELHFNQNLAVALELESILKDLKAKGKLPADLEESLNDVSALVERKKDYIKWNKERIDAVLARIFKKSAGPKEG